MSDSVSRLDYCQYLLASQINYTLTNYADHCQKFAHDAINRFLRHQKFTPRLVWENVQAQIVPTAHGYVVFDDTVLDKNYSCAIELVRRPYSGNARGIIKGIGVVTCIYVNPELDQFWLIDYRIYDPDGDGKSKLDHVWEMLTNIVYQKPLPFQAVLMDTWYETKDLMLLIESLGKIYYCPLKDNRQVDDSGGACPYQRVDTLEWSAAALASGKTIKLKGFPKDHKVRCFRVATSTRRTDWVVTNDPAQASMEATQKVCGLRWKIEQLHREGKQVTGLERCQCRKRVVEDILILCCDGLKGLPEAVASFFPHTTVQTCVVHLVRRSLSFVSYKERKAVAADLKPIYQAATETEVLQALDQFQIKWEKRYPDDRPELARELGASPPNV